MPHRETPDNQPTPNEILSDQHEDQLDARYPSRARNRRPYVLDQHGNPDLAATLEHHARRVRNQHG